MKANTGDTDRQRLPRIIDPDQIRIPGSRSLQFEGLSHGAGTSHFVIDNDPGEGPALHRHPYSETWTVLAGQAAFIAGADELTARQGDTIVVPPGMWHRFENTGTGPLQVLCVHDSDVMIQDWLDE